MMDNDWLVRQVEQTKKRVAAMSHGSADVEYARYRAEELNRAEVEEYRLQQRLRDKEDK